MILELRVLDGARAGACERFDKPVVTVGRHPLSDLRFDAQHDLDVSTRHAELHATEDGWSLRDEQSTNGTFVNGIRVRDAQLLHEGDLLSFGVNGPRVEVHLPSRDIAPVAPPAPSAVLPPRRDTSMRIAQAVQQETRSVRRMYAVGAALLAIVAIGAFAVWQRQAAGRERELLTLIARSESTATALERTVKEMQPRDSAFAELLAERAESSKAATAQLKDGSTNVALFSDRIAAAARVQRSVAGMNFAAVHDRNDPAVAMIVSDLDGVFIAGTAFGIRQDGLLLTNSHVVRSEAGVPARRVRVLFANTADWLPAHLVRTASGDDLALIQLDAPGRYPVVAGVSRTGSAARVGAPVASIGFPHATDTPMEGSGLHVTARSTIAAGTVSKRLQDVIQIDSYAGKGSSGSPLFDANANVAGVIYGGAAESNGRIVYAVPAERVATFIADDAPAILRP